METREGIVKQGPKEVVVDAYEEYIKARREEMQEEKIGTLKLPVQHLQAVALLIIDALEDQAARDEPLTPEQERVWKSITNTIVKSIREAE